MSANPLRDRRKRATRWFVMRVCLLVALIGVIAYSAWFASWAKPVRHIPIEISASDAK